MTYVPDSITTYKRYLSTTKPHPAHHYCKHRKNILRETENKMANFPLMIA